jgi:diguanylate cyclase (GGDEF)-like protein
MSVLMLDIDYFKQINDRFGHGIGDLVIQQFAKTCASLLRKEDLFGRIGGEEFAVLLSNTSLDTAEMIGEKLRQGIAQTPIPTESDLIQITTSVGVAAIHLNDTVENALTRADIALYQAKANGRDRVESHHG